MSKICILERLRLSKVLDALEREEERMLYFRWTTTLHSAA